MLWESFDILYSLACKEDLATRGDATSSAIFDQQKIKTRLVSKSSGILAGIDFFSECFLRLDKNTGVIIHKNDGQELKKGDIVAEVNGYALSVLSMERIALNFICYLSGIATLSHRYACEAAKYGNTVILDTRKTLPGYRALANYAARTGGAANHRMGLYDMIMIKDNHIDAAGSISKAVQQVKTKWNDKLKIEVECRTIDEVKEAVSCAVDLVMLDNMPPAMIRQALEYRKNGIQFEISGNVVIEKLAELACLSADFISVGALTHSVPAFDFSLKTENV